MPNHLLSPLELSNAIKEAAYQFGFDLCRIQPVAPANHADFFDQWLALGRAGEMHYLERHADKRRYPERLSDSENVSFHSMIVLGVNHYRFPLSSAISGDPSRGIIASYAWGDDYHEIIRPALFALDSFIAEQVGRQSRGKCLVDTGPVLERDWAQQAGVGFTGKNCCTIHPQLGSWLLLATITVPEKLLPDATPHILQQPTCSPESIIAGVPADQEYGRWVIQLSDEFLSIDPMDPMDRTKNSAEGMVTCGRCTRCLDDCPTNAFIGPYHLDPLRCISYWTIESRTAIPRDLRAAFGNRIFGCDICQEVCPWNQRLPHRAPLMAGLAAQEERIAPPLLEGFRPETPYWLNQGAFSERFRRSPIKRAKRAGMLRNVCVALGNWADPAVIEPLVQALNDEDPLPRGHAAWALGQVRKQHKVDSIDGILASALESESVEWVQEEMWDARNG